MDSRTDIYEAVIGLEVHTQLDTESKVFCGCSTTFGQPPNAATCPVCLGLPGVLPVLNKKAFRYALKVALALNCEIQRVVKFDRKNYYYPDLPKNYQISQFDKPLAFNGKVPLMNDSEKSIDVRRVHLEEDAGKLLHDQDKVNSVVDYNRAGMPLLEIVTEPVIRSPEEAYDYLTSLKVILLYLGISDCNMEEGSLRCDANISVRKKGDSKLGVKSELKNMNSFKAVRLALQYEIERHIEVLTEGGSIRQETRLWEADKSVTLPMRTKEETHDYRYFPEPDLVPFLISDEDIRQMRLELPEMPLTVRMRFVERYRLSIKDAGLLVADKSIADFFEKTTRLTGDAKSVTNWVMGDIMRELNEKGITISAYGLTPEMLAELIALIKKGTISGKMAKKLLIECAEKKVSPENLVEKQGLKQISNEAELETIVKKVIKENPKSVEDFGKGKKNAVMFLVGQVMKQTKGKANPAMVNELLLNLLSK